MKILKFLKKNKRENLIITVDILSKIKYNHKWQRANIGNKLSSFISGYFKENAIVYFKDKNFFTGFEMVLSESRFKLYKIEDNRDPNQFIYRYKDFLPYFLEFMDSVLKDLKLKYKFYRIQHFDSSMEEYLKGAVIDKMKSINKKKRIKKLIK